MKFQSIVIIILGILLVITIISFCYIAATPGKVPYPNSIPVCPDYYFQSGPISPNGSVTCTALPSMKSALQGAGVTSDNLDYCTNPTFSSAFYTGTKANCLKYNWDNGAQCKSVPSWEGITYGVRNPCAT